MLGPLRHFKLQFLSSEAEKKTSQCCGKTGISLMGSRCLHSTDAGSWPVGQSRERQHPQSSWPQRCWPSLQPHPTTHHLSLILPPSAPTALLPALPSTKGRFSFLLVPSGKQPEHRGTRTREPTERQGGADTASPFLLELKQRQTMVYNL